MSRQQQKQLDAERAYAADLQAVMSTPQGRRVLWRLIDDHSSSFSAEPLVMAWGEGKRAVRLEVEADCKRFAVDGYKLMLREALDRLDAPSKSEPEPLEED